MFYASPCICESCFCNPCFVPQSVCGHKLGFPFFREKDSILKMEWSGNLFRKVEFQENSGWNRNRKFSGLRYLTRNFFRFTEWKTEISETLFLNSKTFRKYSGFYSVNRKKFQVPFRKLEKFPGSIISIIITVLQFIRTISL